MNPEPPSATGNEAPAAASPVALESAAQRADAGTASDGVRDDAPDTVPDQLRELPVDTPRVALASEAASAADEPGSVATLAGGAAPAAAPAVPEMPPAATGARLAELFPALFAAAAPGAPGPAKPIKLRIHADIQARAPGLFSKRVLGLFFSRYTTTTAYLKALVNAPQRLGLDGEAAGDITEEHRQLARDELARRQALAAERRAALRPPRRERPPTRESDAAQATAPDAAPDLRASARPEKRPERRPDNRPPGRPPQRPRGDAPRGDAPRPEQRGARNPDQPAPQRERPARPPQHADRGPRAEHTPPHRPAPRQAMAPPAPRVDTAPALPADPAQRERAMLLRNFESSPLSKANFCALKGLTETALDAALKQAQAERGSPAPAPPASLQPRGGSRR